MSSLAFLAGVTSRIHLGSSVLVLPHRNPIIMAKMLATIDILSGGRVILGAGVGYLEEEIDLLCESFKDRGAISDEYVVAMRELWTNPDPVFKGRYTSFKDIKCEPKPLQSPLPIWFGGHSRRMIRRTVKFGDGFIFAADTIDNFKVLHALLEEDTAEANRDPGTIEKVVLLTSAYFVDAALAQIEQYKKLKMEHFIVYLASWGSSLEEYLSVLTDFSDKAGMSAN
jgi:probable F420-dependent oxidoreductase